MGDRISAAGHYQMVLSYFDPAVNGTQHALVGGPFHASLLIKGTSDQPVGIVPGGGIKALERPAEAPDDSIKDVVRQAFSVCAAAKAIAVADCPMKGDIRDTGIQNVRWALDSDPLAQASVVFDGDRGAFQVEGPYFMHVKYDAVSLIAFHHDDPVSGFFRATVFWNQGQPVVGGIARTR